MEVKIRLRCWSPESCGELAEFALGYRGVGSSLIRCEVRGSILEVSVAGPPNDVLTTRRALMRAYEEWRRLREFKSGRSGRIDLRLLASTLGKPVIPEVLEMLLELRGFHSEVRGGELVTNAPPDTVFELAREVAEGLEEVSRRFPKANHNLKSLLVALSVLGYDAEEELKSLKERGLIEEGRRLGLRSPWSSLLTKLYSLSSGARRGEDRDQEGG